MSATESIGRGTSFLEEEKTNEMIHKTKQVKTRCAPGL
jgi:hypothetical protein